MDTEKYKKLVEQRVKGTVDDWISRDSVEEREIYRFLHNLQGTAGTIGLSLIEEEAALKLQLFTETSSRLLAYSEWYELLESLLLLSGGDCKHEYSSEPVTGPLYPLSDWAGNRVLIIDDDVDLAAYLKGLLEERGYPVNIALTAERGLKLFYDWKPDMIILDVLLPDKNGMDVLEQIVEKSQQAHSPIIVISREDTKENRLRTYRLGAADFFAKPIDQELLIALIENRFHMKQQWERSIIVDELTGAYNRKHFNQVMKQLILDFQRSKRVFTIVLIDIDHFKQVNDTYGHLMGDEVLRSFASIIMDTKREEDILCRYGGEEFALILPHTDKTQSVELLQRIRTAISSCVFTPGIATCADPGASCDKGEQFQVTFTAGITDIHADNAHQEKLVEEADQAMYLGKQSGRNQTIVFSAHLLGDHKELRLHILVVDDDPLIRDIVVSHFSQWRTSRNMHVQVTLKGYEDGIQFLNSGWYSEQDRYIILLDGAMPAMDGVEVLGKLRKVYPERSIAIAMLTARINQTHVIHALQHGADDYIIKPFQLSELEARVERLLRKVLF